MNSQRTCHDSDKLTGQDSVSEEQSEPRYRFNEKTKKILLQNENGNVKLTPMDDKFFEWLRSL